MRDEYDLDTMTARPNPYIGRLITDLPVREDDASALTSSKSATPAKPAGDVRDAAKPRARPQAKSCGRLRQ
jgi:hypothetical protein